LAGKKKTEQFLVPQGTIEDLWVRIALGIRVRVKRPIIYKIIKSFKKNRSEYIDKNFH